MPLISLLPARKLWLPAAPQLASRSGSSSANRAPPCSRLAAVMRPPAPSIMEREMARPRPRWPCRDWAAKIGTVMIGAVMIGGPGARRTLCAGFAHTVRRKAGGKDRFLCFGGDAGAVVLDGEEKEASSALAIHMFGHRFSRLLGRPFSRLFAQAHFAQTDVDAARRRAWPQPNS